MTDSCFGLMTDSCFDLRFVTEPCQQSSIVRFGLAVILPLQLAEFWEGKVVCVCLTLPASDPLASDQGSAAGSSACEAADDDLVVAVIAVLFKEHCGLLTTMLNMFVSSRERLIESIHHTPLNILHCLPTPCSHLPCRI